MEAETHQETVMPSLAGAPQNAEFLKYLLDTNDPIVNLQMQLQGQTIEYIEGTPTFRQVSPPLVNISLANKIFTVLQTYNTKGFITTVLESGEINSIVQDISSAVIDLLEVSRSYPSTTWKKDKAFLIDYPSFMQGTQQQILLMIEHTIFTALKRSQKGITLEKVTGMHTSQEIKQDVEKKKGILGVFNK